MQDKKEITINGPLTAMAVRESIQVDNFQRMLNHALASSSPFRSSVGTEALSEVIELINAFGKDIKRLHRQTERKLNRLNRQQQPQRDRTETSNNTKQDGGPSSAPRPNASSSSQNAGTNPPSRKTQPKAKAKAKPKAGPKAADTSHKQTKPTKPEKSSSGTKVA